MEALLYTFLLVSTLGIIMNMGVFMSRYRGPRFWILVLILILKWILSKFK